MTRIKICGITEPELAIVAAEAGADFIGLVFWAQSHRYVSPDKAREIVLELRRSGGRQPAVVGVFVDEPAHVLGRITRQVGLDYVQLCGGEPASIVGELEAPVIRAIRPRDVDELMEIDVWARAGARLLVDAFHPAMPGGQGQVGDWELAAQAARDHPIILAGGLASDNVQRAITEVQPWGIDVSSGVETEKRKDPAKIRAFIQAARNAPR
jgi:phosphoribosylanthranilate isomerase